MRVFVTGASGWIGSAVVPQLVDAGHEVVGLARSDASADALTGAGVEVHRGDLDDLEGLRAAAGAADGVIHLAFKHELLYSGEYEGALEADTRAIEAFGEALAGSQKPFVIASGLLGIAPGRLATEEDGRDAGPDASGTRLDNALATLSLASRGVRSSVVRLPPTVHGEGDNGFMPFIVSTAREKGVSGYLGDGQSRWPAVHRFDAASLFRLAVEKAPAGSVLHAAGDEGVRILDIAQLVGEHLGVPVAAVADEDAGAHFGFLAGFLGLDSPASSVLTRELLGWQPTHPGLIDDLNAGHYFARDPS